MPKYKLAALDLERGADGDNMIELLLVCDTAPVFLHDWVGATGIYSSRYGTESKIEAVEPSGDGRITLRFVEGSDTELHSERERDPYSEKGYYVPKRLAKNQTLTHNTVGKRPIEYRITILEEVGKKR